MKALFAYQPAPASRSFKESGEPARLTYNGSLVRACGPRTLEAGEKSIVQSYRRAPVMVVIVED